MVFFKKKTFLHFVIKHENFSQNSCQEKLFPKALVCFLPLWKRSLNSTNPIPSI